MTFFKDKSYQFQTQAIHVGQKPCETTGAVVPPVYFSSTFAQKAAGDWGKYDYSRSGNPTRDNLQETVAALEGGGHSLAYSSGMAAIHGVSMLLSAGDQIVASADIYGGTYRLFHKILKRSGIDICLVSGGSSEAFEKAVTAKTKLIWIENPGNPLLSLIDIEACAAIAKKYNALLAVDNTFATPVLTQPLTLGADIVVHSATKYLGGHSDLLGGVVTVKDKELYEELYFIQNASGATLGAMDAFLCSRGIKTLAVRVKEQCRNALEIARFLENHPYVKRVFYPGLVSHEQHDLALKQLKGGFGGVMSFELHEGFEVAKRAVSHCRLFRLAVSLGAVESLIEHPASMSHASYDTRERRRHGISDGLVRISIGLEACEDLIVDLDRAFTAAFTHQSWAFPETLALAAHGK